MPKVAILDRHSPPSAIAAAVAVTVAFQPGM